MMMRPSRFFCRIAVLVALVVTGPGCGGDDAGSDDTAGDPADASPGPAPDAGPPPPAVATLDLAACRGLGGVDESCTLHLDASACVTAACARLAIVFSGGDQGCANAGIAPVLDGYTAAGWAVACVDAFETSTGSGAVPYLDEAPRYDLAITTLTTGTWGTAYWTGEDLLFTGISHGATAPLIAMARTALDDQASWRGTGTTAGCFYDGSYDQAATAALLATGAAGGGACTFPVPYQRWLERYCGEGADPDRCDLATEPAARADSIAGAEPAAPGELAILDLRLVECGSATPVCTGDILPAAPIEALCNGLNSGTHTCRYESLPALTHLNCFRLRGDDCRTWFEALRR